MNAWEMAPELARLYGEAHDAVTAADAQGVCPKDIVRTWPNVLGFLRRVPGQPYFRATPNGRDDTPTLTELEVFRDALRIHRDRALRAIERDVSLSSLPTLVEGLS